MSVPVPFQQNAFQVGVASQGPSAPSLDAFQGVQQNAFQGFGGVIAPVAGFSVIAFQGFQHNAFQAVGGVSSGAAPATNLYQWTGSAWTPRVLQRWNGSAWVTADLKHWNGISWL